MNRWNRESFGQPCVLDLLARVPRHASEHELDRGVEIARADQGCRGQVLLGEALVRGSCDRGEAVIVVVEHAHADDMREVVGLRERRGARHVVGPCERDARVPLRCDRQRRDDQVDAARLGDPGKRIDVPGEVGGVVAGGIGSFAALPQVAVGKVGLGFPRHDHAVEVTRQRHQRPIKAVT